MKTFKRLIISMLACLTLMSYAQAEHIKIKLDPRGFARPNCAPGTGVEGVPCASGDYVFNTADCKFAIVEGIKVGNCIVDDDFGTRSQVYGIPCGSGYCASWPYIIGSVLPSEIAAVGGPKPYGNAVIPRAQLLLDDLTKPKCPNPDPSNPWLMVDKYTYDILMNMMPIVDGVISADPQTPWPHAACPQ